VNEGLNNNALISDN